MNPFMNQTVFAILQDYVFAPGGAGRILRLYRRKEKGEFAERDLFALSQLHKHLAYRLIYEAKRGDTRFFFAKGTTIKSADSII